MLHFVKKLKLWLKPVTMFGKFAICLIGVTLSTLIFLSTPVQADVIYQWITASVTNFDPVACGTAACQNSVLAQLAASDTLLNNGSEQLTVTDALAAGGSTAGSAPGGCTTCALPSGIISLAGYGDGPSSLKLNFSGAPFLSGSVNILTQDFGYSLTGSGSDWSGYFNGETSFFGEDCFTPGLNNGCAVTGYWLAVSTVPSASPPTATPEPSSLPLIAVALAAIAFARRRRHHREFFSRKARGCASILPSVRCRQRPLA